MSSAASSLSIRLLRHLSAGCLALGLATAAQAGHVVVNFDPTVTPESFGFGVPAVMSSNSYSGSVNFMVSDSCALLLGAASAGSSYVSPLSVCGSNITASVLLTLFETANPLNSVSTTQLLTVTSVRANASGVIDRINTQMSGILGDFSGNPLSGGLFFQYQFSDLLTTVFFMDSCGGGSYGCSSFFMANTDGTQGTLTQTLDDGSGALGVDINGQPASYIYSYAEGWLSLTSNAVRVPEPATLGLLLPALLALGATRRRQRR